MTAFASNYCPPPPSQQSRSSTELNLWWVPFLLLIFVDIADGANTYRKIIDALGLRCSPRIKCLMFFKFRFPLLSEEINRARNNVVMALAYQKPLKYHDSIFSYISIHPIKSCGRRDMASARLFNNDLFEQLSELRTDRYFLLLTVFRKRDHWWPLYQSVLNFDDVSCNFSGSRHFLHFRNAHNFFKCPHWVFL